MMQSSVSQECRVVEVEIDRFRWILSSTLEERWLKEKKTEKPYMRSALPLGMY